MIYHDIRGFRRWGDAALGLPLLACYKPALGAGDIAGSMSLTTPYRSEGKGCALLRASTLILFALLTAGCSTSGLGSRTEGTTSSSSGSVPFGDRVSALFGGGSQSTAATQASAAAATPTSDDFDCPRIDIRAGASTLLLNASAGDPNAMSLRYQGTFVRAARECRVQAPNVNIKVGVQGRVILGPSGTPGEVAMPLRYALVQETIGSSKVLWSKLYIVPVNIPADQPSANFTHISEDLTLPIPGADVLDSLVLYIGFDPIGAEEEKKRRAPPPRTQQRRTR
jgi:hypothetical protein